MKNGGAVIHMLTCSVRRRWLRRRLHMPFWRDDKVAQMLGVAQFGCRRCGRGAIEERDSTPPAPEGITTHDDERGAICPTCGPTGTERHPRRAGVSRCTNCKEHLTTPDASTAHVPDERGPR